MSGFWAAQEDIPITERDAFCLTNWATQPCLDKLERILDQEITFETDVYKATSVTSFHSILIGIFLLLSPQFFGLLYSFPRGWIHEHLTSLDLTALYMFPISVVLFGCALANAHRLQSPVDDYRGPKARGSQADLRTDAASYIAALSGQSGDLGKGWLTLRVIEDKLRIIKTYRGLNQNRVRAHCGLTWFLLFSIFLAMFCTSRLWELHHTTLVTTSF